MRGHNNDFQSLKEKSIEKMKESEKIKLNFKHKLTQVVDFFLFMKKKQENS